MKIKSIRLYQAVKVNNRLETSLDVGRPGFLSRNDMEGLEMRLIDGMVFVHDKSSGDAVIIGLPNIAEIRPANIEEFKAKMGAGIVKKAESKPAAKKTAAKKPKPKSELDELD